MMSWTVRGGGLLLALVVALTALPAAAQLPAMRDRPLSAAERTRLQALEGDIQRISRARNTSAAAVRTIAGKLGARLTTTDPAQIIRLIDERAGELAEAKARIGALEEQLVQLDSMRLARAVSPLLEAAQTAIDEGDLDLAEAKLAAAADQFGSARANLEGQLEAVSTQEANVLAQRAVVRRASFDALGAAELYAQAAALIPAENRELRWRYLKGQGDSLTEAGGDAGDAAILTRAVAVLRDEALPLVSREERLDDWLDTQDDLSHALRRLGGVSNDPVIVAEAAAVARAAADATPSGDERQNARRFQLAAALSDQAAVGSDMGARDEALAIYSDLLPRVEAPSAAIVLNYGVILARTASVKRDAALARLGADTMAQAAASIDRVAEPRLWRQAQSNRALALGLVASLTNDAAARREGIAVLEQTLAAIDRDQFNDAWIRLHGELASAYGQLAAAEDAEGRASAEKAVEHARTATQAVDAAASPALYTRSLYFEGQAIRIAADLQPDLSNYDLALATFERARAISTADRNLGEWAELTVCMAETWLQKAVRLSGAEREAALAAAEGHLKELEPRLATINDAGMGPRIANAREAARIIAAS
ncbi:hypothetical protein [Brevundimonas sp.]|uniref:hypothetical protein n=1 Tax=Brevundimonas sp. TaxID=1871086 RepID=UPI0035B065E9